MDTQTREWKKILEPTRVVHAPWNEQLADDHIEWAPDANDCYTGAKGGPKAGPSAKMKEVIRTATDLSSVFLFILNWKFWNVCARRSDKYAYKDWVVADSSSSTAKNPKLKNCKPGTEGARHRADNEPKQYKFTASFVLVFISILILMGAHYGSHKPALRRFWAKPPYGISHPYIQNAMTHKSFCLCVGTFILLRITRCHQRIIRVMIHYSKYGLC